MPISWRLRSATLTTQDHTLIMGVVNVTPDSFSERESVVTESGMVHTDIAIARGVRSHEQGADLVDVGGQSTRPGSRAVSAEEELARVEPVVAGLTAAGVPVSIDTSRPRVAAAAIAAGAEVVNDVTALRRPEMAALCAGAGVGVVLMHMQDTPEIMQLDPRYGDVVVEVAAELEALAGAAIAAGVSADRICVDPGIGFGKTLDHNLALLTGLRRIGATGFPVLVGTSRKGFLGGILKRAGHPAEPADRDPATGASVALAIAHGASVVRVHNVAEVLQSARTADAIVRHGHD